MERQGTMTSTGGKYYRICISSFVKLLLVCVLSCAMTRASKAQESADDNAVTYGAEIDFNSRFLWRGMANSRGAVLQPSAYLTYRDFTLSSWSNCDLQPGAAEPHLNETDLTLAHSREWKDFSFEGLIQAYLYPASTGVPGTSEAAFSVRYGKSVGVFSRHSFDLMEYRGAYFGEAGVDWQKTIGQKLELEASAGTGWGNTRFNEGYFEVSKNAVNVFSVDFALSWQASKIVAIRPHLSMSSLLDSKLRDSAGEPDLFSVGIAIGVNF